MFFEFCLKFSGFLVTSALVKRPNLLGFVISMGYPLVDSFGFLFIPQIIQHTDICKFIGISISQT